MTLPPNTQRQGLQHPINNSSTEDHQIVQSKNNCDDQTSKDDGSSTMRKNQSQIDQLLTEGLKASSPPDNCNIIRKPLNGDGGQDRLPHQQKQQQLNDEDQQVNTNFEACTLPPFPQRNISRLLRESDADILERGLMENDRYISAQNTPLTLPSSQNDSNNVAGNNNNLSRDSSPIKGDISGRRRSDHSDFENEEFDLGPSALSIHQQYSNTPTSTNAKSAGGNSTNHIVNKKQTQHDEKSRNQYHILRLEPQDGGNCSTNQLDSSMTSAQTNNFLYPDTTAATNISRSCRSPPPKEVNICVPYSKKDDIPTEDEFLASNEANITTTSSTAPLTTKESQITINHPPNVSSTDPTSITVHEDEGEEQEQQEEQSNRGGKSKIFRQSQSYHRRLNEAAQFVKAIGEVPEDGMIQVIIDDDDHVNDDTDDDDDEEENEIVEKEMVLEAIDEHWSLTANHDIFQNDEKVPLNGHDNADMNGSNRTRDSMLNYEESLTSIGAIPSITESFFTASQTPQKSTLATSSISGYLNTALPLPDNSNDEQQAYIGIEHNPPKITVRGMSRGNYAQLHRKAWLEVSDKYHRYGKNLRLYYKHWESLGHPQDMFFDWLDSKDEDKPNLEKCPRSVLDSDRVMYIMDPEEQKKYLLKIKVNKTRSKSTGKIESTSTQIVDVNDQVVRTGSNGWIFVLRDHELYGAEKVTRSCDNSKKRFRFHHSSFFGGKAVAAAGILITNEDGSLEKLYPHSGHYRPGEAHMQRMLFHLSQRGVDLDTFKVDMQQILHVSREIRDERTPKGGRCEENKKKAKKTDHLQLKSATYVALFLAHKAKLIRIGLLTKIHKIRCIDYSKRLVGNVLNVVDNGGYWPTRKVRYCFGENVNTIIEVKCDANMGSCHRCKVVE